MDATKTKEIAIKKLVIKMGDKEVSITMDEAKKLKEALEELFGKQIMTTTIMEEHHHHHDHYPTRPFYPYQPYWVYTDTKYLCQNGTSIDWKPAFNSVCLNLNPKTGEANG